MLIIIVIAIALGVFAVVEVIVTSIERLLKKKRHIMKIKDMHFRQLNGIER